MFAEQGNGFLLIVLALAFLLPVLVIIAFRRNASERFSPQGSSVSQTTPDSKNTNEGILVVQSGGRVEYINDLARDWFGLRPDEQPDLERIIRRSRPAEDLLNLCATPGQKRISIDHKLVEVASYRVPAPSPQMLVALKAVEFSKNITDSNDGVPLLR